MTQATTHSRNHRGFMTQATTHSRNTFDESAQSARTGRARHSATRGRDGEARVERASERGGEITRATGLGTHAVRARAKERGDARRLVTFAVP